MRNVDRLTPVQFFVSTVRPTVDEFLSEVRDIRRGRLAAIVLHHMVDHAALEGYGGNDRTEMQAKIDQLRKQLVEACPAVALIHDIADASKHAILSVPKKTSRQLSTAGQVSRPPGAFGAPFGTAVFGEASWVMVTLDSGVTRPLAGIVRQVLMMWEAMLFPVGPFFPPE